MELTSFNWTYLAIALLYGLALFNCVHVLTNRLNSGATIAWIAVNLVIPFVGIPLYYVVGNYRITGYRRLHKRRTKALDSDKKISSEYIARKEKFLSQFTTDPETTRNFAQVFRTYGEIFEPDRAELELLIDGKNTFSAIFRAIAGAKHYIFIQYYILRSDRLGLELKELLVRKAKEGVPIYILYDDMGSFWLSRQYIKDLRRSGVYTARFLPLTKLRRFFQVNFRNHRKTVVVDGELAFTGGLNVGEEYAASHYKSKKRIFNYWRDTHIQVKGPLVKHFEGIFFEDWFFATKQRLDVIAQTYTPPSSRPAEQAISYPNLAQVIPTGPADETLLSLLMLQLLINAAKERLWIASPYLVLDPVIVHGLELAARRGVDVRIMIPAKSDNLWVHWVSLTYADQMMEKGCRVYLYQKGFMHQKVFLADTTASIVGTMNLDNRAIYLNFETSVVIHDSPFNQQIAATLSDDFTHCTLLQRPRDDFWLRLKQLRNNIARILGPLL